jgi:importin subunit beta-1
MSSEINQVLANSLSRDANLRNSAEQQLAQASQSNFPLYLATLVQELANEQAEGSIRAAAGIALKNAFTARDYERQQELQHKWLLETDDETRRRVKELTLQTLGSANSQAGNAAAQVVASIAGIELPKGKWDDLMPFLVKNVSDGADHQKQASLTTIGYICESSDTELRVALVGQSNAILTAVVQGARKEETNPEVRLAAISALGDSLEFVENNFRHTGERNYIMQVVCEATQADDARIKQGAFGCLNRIMGLYYEEMRFYMEKALFGLTILGMKNDDEDVAKLAVEFWSSVCEEEIRIVEENLSTAPAEMAQPFYNFARVATNEVVPVLLNLLTKVDEDATDDEYNISKAAYQCLQLYAQAVGATIISPVLQFVEANLRHDDWHHRDAAVSAFGAIMFGPDEKVLEPLIKQALPILITMTTSDSSVHVQDSTAYALGRITEACSGALDEAHLASLVQALLTGVVTSPKMALSCCWALMNVAERFGDETIPSGNPLAPHFTPTVTKLLEVTARTDGDGAVRTAAYEVLNTFVHTAGPENTPAVVELASVIVQRLEETRPLHSQVVSVEDRITLEDMMTSLCASLQAIIIRLDSEVAPLGDRIMEILLETLRTFVGKSSVPEAVFAAIGAMATVLEEDFIKYMEAFNPFLLNALGNQEEPGLCAMAIGLVGDITRSVGDRSQPFCDNFMNYLLNNLRSTTLSNQFKPAILQCFGDIAGAISGHFETYLSVVAQVLHQASSFTPPAEGPIELYDYVIALREGIMDAWGGIIGAMKSSGKAEVLRAYIEPVFVLLHLISTDGNRNESLVRSSMGVIGDIAETYPNGELVEIFGQEWLTSFIKETKTNREYTQRTIDTAKWAREQVKRQIGGPTAAPSLRQS